MALHKYISGESLNVFTVATPVLPVRNTTSFVRVLAPNYGAVRPLRYAISH